MVERLKVTAEIHGIVTGRQIHGKLPFRRRILHYQVDSSSDSITFHIGGQRFGHFQTVKHLRWENIQRHETVLVVRTRNLHPINQSIIVTLVHTTQNRILTFSAAVPLDGHSRHTLNHIRYRDIRRKFNGFGTHHVNHIHRLTFNAACTRFRSSRIGGHHHYFIQCHIISFQRNHDFFLVRSDGHLIFFVSHIRTHQCIFIPINRQIKTSVQPRNSSLSGLFLYHYRCTDNFLSCLRILNLSFYHTGLHTCRHQ